MIELGLLKLVYLSINNANKKWIIVPTNKKKSSYWKFQILIPLFDKNLKVHDKIHVLNFDVLVLFFFPIFSRCFTISMTHVLAFVLHKKYFIFTSLGLSFILCCYFVILCHMDVLLEFIYDNAFFNLSFRYSFSNWILFDFIANNLFSSFNSLHSCKMLIYIYIYIFIYLKNVGYKLSNVVS